MEQSYDGRIGVEAATGDKDICVVCGEMTAANFSKYHPTNGLMQILHFNWIRYSRTISNSPRVPPSVTLSLVSVPNKYFFNFLIVIGRFYARDVNVVSDVKAVPRRL